MNFSPVSCFYLPLGSKCYLHHPVLTHPVFFAQCKRPSFMYVQNGTQIYSWILKFSRWEDKRFRRSARTRSPSLKYSFPNIWISQYFCRIYLVSTWWLFSLVKRKGNLEVVQHANLQGMKMIGWHDVRCQSFMTDLNAFFSGWQPSQMVQVDQHFSGQLSVRHQVPDHYPDEWDGAQENSLDLSCCASFKIYIVMHCQN